MINIVASQQLFLNYTCMLPRMCFLFVVIRHYRKCMGYLFHQSRRVTRQETSSIDTDGGGGSDGAGERRNTDFVMVDDEQNYKDMTHLLQRKISMQFKVPHAMA